MESDSDRERDRATERERVGSFYYEVALDPLSPVRDTLNWRYTPKIYRYTGHVISNELNATKAPHRDIQMR